MTMENSRNIAIGFADKFYTLWNVSRDNVRDRIAYTYIKNISSDVNVVNEMYPGVEIDYTLRGHTRIERYENKPKYPEDCFQYGKYAGKVITECDDYDYMHWYYNNGANPRQSEIIVSVLEPVGYRLIRTNIRYGGEDHLYETLMTPEEVRQHDEYERNFNEIIDYIKNNNTIDVTITANPEPEYDKEGTYTMPTDNKSIIVVVSEAKEQYYNGYTYYLPIINGKARRVKNKKITIDCSNYEILGNRILIRI